MLVTTAWSVTTALAACLMVRQQHTSARLRRSLAATEQAGACDPLTGLGNRRALESALARSSSPRGPAADPVLMLGLLDLNDFKAVNDRYGHASGDLLLVAVAQRLRAAMAGQGIVTRIGGDEFVLLWHAVPGGEPGCPPGRQAAAAEARRVLNRMSGQAVRLEDHEVRPTGSLGIAVGRPDALPDTATAQEYLRTADLAMYAAKRRAREGGVPVHVSPVHLDAVSERRQGSRTHAVDEPVMAAAGSASLTSISPVVKVLPAAGEPSASAGPSASPAPASPCASQPSPVVRRHLFVGAYPGARPPAVRHHVGPVPG